MQGDAGGCSREVSSPPHRILKKRSRSVPVVSIIRYQYRRSLPRRRLADPEYSDRSRDEARNGGFDLLKVSRSPRPRADVEKNYWHLALTCCQKSS
jgi:hypothetical protein